MSTAAVPDKKGIVSSLSADAAEFVPLAAPIPDGATVKGEVISGKGEAPSSVQIRDVPQFLTSCFPFVQLDGDLRTDIGNRFPLPMQYTGIPQTVPMPNPAPVRLPPWPNIRPGLIGSFPTQAAFGSLPYMDTIATAVSVSQERSQGEGLLPAPVGLPLPGLHNTPGLILAAQPGHISTPPWLLTSAPPPVPPPQHSVFLLSQQQHRSLTSVPSTTLTTVSASAGSISSIAASKCQTSEATTLASVKQRAISPVLISRSAQTYFPKQIHNLTLKEKPHPLYIRSHGKHKSDKQKASNDQEQDSDSGYNSPLQAKKLISCGTQVFTTVLSPRSDNNLAVEVRSTSSAKSAVAAVIEKGHGKTSATEDSVGDARKKAKKKKDQRPLSVRSPHALGSSSKLLSRSSSSISSAGTRPEEDDEKIDLHSWTDFPPMVPKSGGGVAGRPALSPSLGPSGHGEGQADRVALTIERTAHAPPWTIKYTVDSSNSSRSSSGEKEKCGGVVTSAGTMGTHPENIFVHPKNVRGVKHSKESTGSGKEVSKLIQGNNLGTLPPAAAVHKPNTTCVTATTLNTSPVASTVTTTISKTLNTSLVTTSQANKGVPYSQVIKMPVTQTGLSNPINSMTFSPVNAVHSPSLASAFPGPSLSGSNQPALSVPPPPLLLSAPCANQQTCAGGRPPLPMAFSGPPPPFTHPPPPPHTPLHSFPGIPIPHLYHLPPPPAPVLGQHHQAVRPAYPSQPVPGLHHQTPPRVPAPASLAGPMPVATSRSTPVSSKQEGTQSSLDPTGRQIRAGSILPSQDSVIQSNIGMKNTLTLHAQVPRPPHAAMASKKSTPAAVASLNPPGEGPVSSALAPIVADGMDGEDKKRRRRRRRRGRGQGLGGSEGLTREGSPGLEHAISSSNVSESTLHFEDVDEFPDLVAGNRGYLPGEECGGADRATLSGTSLSYSDVIKATWSKASSQSRTQSLTGSCVSGDDEDNASNHTGTSNLSKRARKRRRRREQANKAAEVELAEISLEQQWLQQVGLRKSPTNAPPRGGLITNPATVGEAKVQAAGKAAAGGKKFHQPIAFDIAAMIDAIQKKPAAQAVQPGVGKSGLGGASSKSRRKDCKESTGNVLDSTAPLQKRGKEREIPRAKKPSPLKKVILKEREQRKRLRLLDGDPDTASGISGSKSGGVGIIGGESELSQEALSSKSEGTDEGEVGVTAELSADLSPISQTSPISMSPASPGNSGVSSPSAGSIGRDPVIMKIHSRRFREYCTQILDKEIDQCCTSLLQELVKFQDRMYHKNPVKAKSKRRVVLGLREVTKHLKLKRIKCVVISPNLEKIQSKGGLDEALNTILTMCQEQNVPFVFIYVNEEVCKKH
ncbi:hypothetical protein RRG08_033996 [Elysia crispata]|uniref:Ribosomal protein eL8/eL30/eS12/Gadd45 domain-containing protein n=1 Tax=Elysia crispata TaxID=231223 RepID=A0AAE1CKQ1_9GAST|nr:hypothetical protein RRG08_033996 [Elysia crispata]